MSNDSDQREERPCDADFGYPGTREHSAHDWGAQVQATAGAPWRDETFTCPGVPTSGTTR